MVTSDSSLRVFSLCSSANIPLKKSPMTCDHPKQGEKPNSKCAPHEPFIPRAFLNFHMIRCNFFP